MTTHSIQALSMLILGLTEGKFSSIFGLGTATDVYILCSIVFIRLLFYFISLSTTTQNQSLRKSSRKSHGRKQFQTILWRKENENGDIA